MSDIEVTIRLPEELVDRVKAAELEIESITDDVIALLEKRLARKQAWQEMVDIAKRLQGSLTPEEIEAELQADKSEHRAKADHE